MQITISAPEAPNGQYFGRIDLKQLNGTRELHLPVAFFRRQGDVTLTQTCAPSTIVRQTGRSDCTVSVHNPTLTPADVSLVSETSTNMRVLDATNAEVHGPTQGEGQRDDRPTAAGRTDDRARNDRGLHPARPLSGSRRSRSATSRR